MELNEFLEKFLPDYHERFNRYKKENGYKYRLGDESSILSDFNESNFPEALQNFADRICEEQRERCCRYAKGLKEDGSLLASDMLFAEQPKIDEL